MGLSVLQQCGISMFVFFNLECPVFFFQFHTDINIHIHPFRIIFIIFYKSTTEFIHSIYKFSFLVNQIRIPRLFFLPILKSSAPNAGAVCTIPVPSSVVTKSPVITLNGSARHSICGSYPGCPIHWESIARSRILDLLPVNSELDFPGNNFGSRLE